MKSTIFFVIVLLSGCSTILGQLGFEETYAEKQAGYSYVPVEPSSVKINCTGSPPVITGNNCVHVSKQSLLDALPDNSVRIATRQVSGSISTGIPAIGGSIGIAGNSYEVIIDFVNTQTVNKQFVGKWFVTVPDTVSRVNRCYPYETSVLDVTPLDKFEDWSLRAELLEQAEYSTEDNYRTAISNFDKAEARRLERQNIRFRCPKKTSQNDAYSQIQITPERFNIPVYYGIGLRLMAKVTVLKGEVNLSSLPALTAAVDGGFATGTMSVQTIGISGKAARSNLLLLDKIDTTTIQNAIQVLASIKASIESGDTTISPRIVGFHNTIGAGPQGVNLIHSLLSSDPNSQLDIDQASFATGSVDRVSLTGRQPNIDMTPN
ncbi:MAG: hypothetical protein ACJAVI_006165 [Candidatus Azotimanducaceae bacterium]|jgi:hypothetical protein